MKTNGSGIPRGGLWLGTLLTFAAFASGAFSCSSGDDTTGGAGNGTGASGGAGATGGAGGHAVACIPGLQSIALTPADSTVTLDGGPATPIAFTATGTLGDSSTVTIPATSLAWSATRPDATPPGTIVDGVLTPYPSAGGIVTVTAEDGCAVSGSTTVHFVLDVTIGQPSDPLAWDGLPVTDAASPLVVYPSDKTRFPRNIYRTLFQWRSQGYTEFRLVYTGDNSTVTVYTDGVHGLCAAANPAAGCWEVDELAWEQIAGSNAGGTVSWVVDGLDTSTDPPTVRRSEPIELGFSLQNVEGAIFYWSTTSAGIRRGRISQQNPEDYIVAKPVGTSYPDGETVKCVACHTVSRDGRYMAAPVQSTNTDSLWILEVTPDPPPTPLVEQIPNTKGHGFGTISPDNANVVVAYGGDMWMVDRATGAFIEDLPLGALAGTQPDWRPDGTELVFATGGNDSPGNAALALIPYTNGAWGAPSILLPPPNNKTNIFPMFSPAGDWIAFSQGKGGHGDNTAQLWVTSHDGATSVELVNANRVTSNQMTTGQYENSLPTWAPPGDYDWIAFNTKRAYGVVLPQGLQQIWVAAIDLDKAANGEDPSYPAFRVPFQGLAENNHRAYWTLDIGAGGTGGGGGTGGQGGGPAPCSNILTLGEVCDPLETCCESGSYCDSADGGVTWVCTAPA
ncbi:MAG: hypothetical protein IT373_05715 [Polyangiaceae bacterium]|nr:hypothetical protein [Polyangiaceae bacterium]